MKQNFTPIRGYCLIDFKMTLRGVDYNSGMMVSDSGLPEGKITAGDVYRGLSKMVEDQHAFISYYFDKPPMISRRDDRGFFLEIPQGMAIFSNKMKIWNALGINGVIPLQMTRDKDSNNTLVLIDMPQIQDVKATDSIVYGFANKTDDVLRVHTAAVDDAAAVFDELITDPNKKPRLGIARVGYLTNSLSFEPTPLVHPGDLAQSVKNLEKVERHVNQTAFFGDTWFKFDYYKSQLLIKKRRTPFTLSFSFDQPLADALRVDSNLTMPARKNEIKSNLWKSNAASLFREKRGMYLTSSTHHPLTETSVPNVGSCGVIAQLSPTGNIVFPHTVPVNPMAPFMILLARDAEFAPIEFQADIEFNIMGDFHPTD